jgi:hypothetical protein
MRVEVAYADGRLDAWASWVRGNQGAWPPRTLLGRIIEEGASGASQGSGTESMPQAVADTDRAVARLDFELRKVTKVYYLTHASSEIKAVACRCSRATFWRRVERAQVQVYILLCGETETRYSQADLQAVSL